jgi:hypothetical protein
MAYRLCGLLPDGGYMRKINQRILYTRLKKARCHCEARSNEAISWHAPDIVAATRLLRCARNDSYGLVYGLQGLRPVAGRRIHETN